MAWYPRSGHEMIGNIELSFATSIDRAAMISLVPTPLIRLSNLFPGRDVYAKCEFLAPSGSFKIRGAMHLLDHLRREEARRPLTVPSMGNTALGAATGAQALGFSMTGVV